MRPCLTKEVVALKPAGQPQPRCREREYSGEEGTKQRGGREPRRDQVDGMDRDEGGKRSSKGKQDCKRHTGSQALYERSARRSCAATGGGGGVVNQSVLDSARRVSRCGGVWSLDQYSL